MLARRLGSATNSGVEASLQSRGDATQVLRAPQGFTQGLNHPGAS